MSHRNTVWGEKKQNAFIITKHPLAYLRRQTCRIDTGSIEPTRIQHLLFVGHASCQAPRGQCQFVWKGCKPSNIGFKYVVSSNKIQLLDSHVFVTRRLLVCRLPLAHKEPEKHVVNHHWRSIILRPALPIVLSMLKQAPTHLLPKTSNIQPLWPSPAPALSECFEGSLFPESPVSLGHLQNLSLQVFGGTNEVTTRQQRSGQLAKSRHFGDARHVWAPSHRLPFSRTAWRTKLPRSCINIGGRGFRGPAPR